MVGSNLGFDSILSLRGHVSVLYGRGNLGFDVLGGVLRRVFIPPQLSEIASSDNTLLAMTVCGGLRSLSRATHSSR